MCNLTWWTLSEDPQREIPLQKVSSISHRSSQGERLNSSLNINAAWSKTRHHVIYSQTAAVFFFFYCLSNFLSHLLLSLSVDTEPSQRVTCGRGTGLCMSTVRRSEGSPPPRVLSVRENVFWSRFCCVNALLLVSVNIFLYAYFAWVDDSTSCGTELLPVRNRKLKPHPNKWWFSCWFSTCIVENPRICSV